MIEASPPRKIIVSNLQIQTGASRKNDAKIGDAIIDIFELLIPVFVFMDFVNNKKSSVILFSKLHRKIKESIFEEIDIIRGYVE
jgi:hypothetical protein